MVGRIVEETLAGIEQMPRRRMDCLELYLTPRGLDAAIRVARTIANMEESANIQEPHLAEAVQYRLFDRRQ